MNRSPYALPFLLAACASPDAPRTFADPMPLLALVAGALDSARVDTVPAGFLRIELTEAAPGGHNLVLFAIPDSVAVATFLAANDTAIVTPLGARALGGPEGLEGGERADATIHRLAPGSYFLGCALKGADGHRHMTSGEWQRIVVTPSTITTPDPDATIPVTMADFAYVTGDTWPAGDRLLAIRNEGKHEHLIVIDRITPGHTVREYLEAKEDDPPISVAAGGMTRIGPGAMAYNVVSLVPGTYVLFCRIVDPASKRFHTDMGMVRVVTVAGS